MVYSDESNRKPSNGTVIVLNSEREGETTSQEDVITLCTVLNRLIGDVLYPDPSSRENSLPRRIKVSVLGNIPLLREAMKNSGQWVLDWTRQGSPLRALLVVSLRTISLISLTGLLVFTLFFVTATVNAIIISLIMSLAAAGGFLVLFFTCVAAIYIDRSIINSPIHYFHDLHFGYWSRPCSDRLDWVIYPVVGSEEEH